MSDLPTVTVDDGYPGLVEIAEAGRRFLFLPNNPDKGQPQPGTYALVRVNDGKADPDDLRQLLPEGSVLIVKENGEWGVDTEKAAGRLSGWEPAGLPPMDQWSYQSYRMAVIDAVLDALAGHGSSAKEGQ